MTITDHEILILQAYAVRTDDMPLLYTTYAALGLDRRVAFMPVTEGEMALARQSCAGARELMLLSGTWAVLPEWHPERTLTVVAEQV